MEDVLIEARQYASRGSTPDRLRLSSVTLEQNDCYADAECSEHGSELTRQLRPTVGYCLAVAESAWRNCLLQTTSPLDKAWHRQWSVCKYRIT